MRLELYLFQSYRTISINRNVFRNCAGLNLWSVVHGKQLCNKSKWGGRWRRHPSKDRHTGHHLRPHSHVPRRGLLTSDKNQENIHNTTR